MVVKSLKCLFILFTYTMSYDLPLTCSITVLTCMVILSLTFNIQYAKIMTLTG